MSLAVKKINYYLSAFINATIFKRPRVYSMPLSISIEASGKCNLNCKYCYQKDWDKNIQREKGIMPLALFKKFIKEVSNNFYPVNINFDLGGEPFLNPALIEMVNLAASYGKLTNITTNASLLDDELIEKVLDSGLDKISISLDIVNGASLKEGVSVREIAERVDNLIVRRNNRKKKTLRIVIRSINLVGVSRRDIRSLLKEKPDAITFTPYTNWAGLIDSFSIPSNRYCRCLLPWLEMAMLYNGDFALCCNDPRGDLIVGRFPNESIAQIWQGEKLNRAREAIAKKSAIFLEGQNCKNCTRLRRGFSFREYFYFLKEN